MIDRRQFFRRFCGAAVSVAIAPLDEFRLPELEPWAPIYGKSWIESLEPAQVERNRELMASLTELTHEIFSEAIVANVKMHTPMLKAFADQPEYVMAGERLVFDVDLRYPVP